MINVSNLSFSYGDKQILSNINFQIVKGECMALMGASGCGKSTLLDCLGGFLSPSMGKIEVHGNVLFSSSVDLLAEKRGIGLVFQGAHLFPNMTVAQNICFGLKKFDREEASKWLVFCELEGFEDKYPSELSGGEQQRVAIARTLAPKPNFICMDEPYSGLDSELKNSLRLKVKAYLKDHDISCLLVTHQLDEALVMGDSLYLLKESQLVNYGATKDFQLAKIDPENRPFFSS